MKKYQLIICGAAGRMGIEIFNLAQTLPWVGNVVTVDYKGRSDHKHLTEISVKGPAVLIDFSLPKGLPNTLQWCRKNKVPCVVGVTGLGKKEQSLLKQTSKTIPVLWSANMSLGVNVFVKLIESLSQLLPDYDWQLEEFHHNKKKDKPSGTGQWLQDEAEKGRKKKLPPILSGRGGGIYGIHKLLLMGPEETLTIEHSALSRALFARGALTAARWLVTRRPGIYSMSNVLDGK
jgi:4-hydroxy-tetrahydrodipicolinate reductase